MTILNKKVINLQIFKKVTKEFNDKLFKLQNIYKTQKIRKYY
jgi:hypothetical protein